MDRHPPENTLRYWPSPSREIPAPSGIPMKEVSRAVFPMVVAQAAALPVIPFWPGLSLLLTRFMR